MEINELQVRLLHAAKTKDQWKVVTSYPKKGEVCLEATTSAGATSFKIKIGDGTRPYCKNTGTPETPVWDFTSDQVLPYFGTTVITDGTISVANIETYVDGSSIKKKLTFYSLSLAASTVEGVTTLSPVLSQTPYLEIKEGTGIEFTTDETGTPKLLNINVSSSYINDAITTAINALDTPSPLNLAEWDSTTKTLSLYSLSESNGIVSKSSTAIATIDLSGIAPVQDVQINNASILSNGTANIAVEGTYNSSTNKIATESTINDAVADLDVTGYNQATIDTTTSNQTTLTVKGIKEDDGKIAADSTQDVNIVMDGTYNASYNKVATQLTVSNAITALDGIPTTVDSTNSANVITSVSESNGVVSSTRKTIVEGNKIDITTPTSGTNAGDIIVSHEDIDTTATDVASTITTDGSSTVDEKELSVITGIKVDAQGHITHIDKDVSTNLVAADIKSPVEMPDDSMWTYRTTGGDITIDKDIANVTDVNGKSLVFNQLVNIDNISYTNSGITIQGTNGVFTISGTASQNAGFALQPRIYTKTGHKYFVHLIGTHNFNSLTWRSVDMSTPHSIIFTETVDSRNVSPSIGIINEQTYSASLQYFVIDLTLMFGADNEPSTVEEFEALYPLDYYDYTATPVLINNSASGIVTTGFNQWDEEWEVGTIDYTTGEKASSSSSIRSKNYIPAFPSTEYHVTQFGAANSGNIVVYFYDSNHNLIVYSGSSAYQNGYNGNIGDFTTPSGTHYMMIRTATAYGTTYNHDICINISDTAKNGTYEPYEKHTFYFDKVLQSEGSLATVTGKLLDGQGQPTGESVVVFPDGLKSAGSVYDEIKGNVAIKRVGSVDLGTLNWNYFSDYSRFIPYNTPSDIKYAETSSIISNLLCPIYEASNLFSFQYTQANMIICCTTNNINVRNTSYTDAATFKAAMSGVMLYYELATPETYILDQTVTGNYIVDDNGTEKLLPEGVDSTTGLPLTTPFSGIIKYQSNFKDVVLDTVDKVSKYKNPVRSKEDKPQTTGKVAVYDSDSTVKSSMYVISNDAIDPEESGTTKEQTVPTHSSVLGYVRDVVNTEVTVQDVTTTDDDVSGNGGIRVTNTGTTYDVHHAGITQAADVTHTITPEEGNNNEAVVKLVTGVITDDFGHVKGKEVISSDKLIAADIKAPVKQTDNTTWNHRITGGDITIGEDTAKISVLKGNTMVWNQLVDSSTSSVTLASSNRYYTIISSTKSIQTGAGTAVSVTGGTDMVINLTKMFGSDADIVSALGLASVSEITTNKAVQAFEKLFPSNYYEYNEGELVSLNVEVIKSIGFNQWDEEWEVGAYDNSGTKVFNQDVIRSLNFIRVIPGTYIYPKFPQSDYGWRYVWYDAEGNFISSAPGNPVNTPILIPSNCYYMNFCTNSYYGGTYNHDICINISDPSKNGTYEPYKQDTLNLTWIKDIKDSNDNQLFPYGLLSAGSVRDEVTATKAIKRVGAVDLGNILESAWEGTSASFTTNVLVGQVKAPSATSIKANILCTVYETITWDTTATDMQIAVNTDGTLYIKNSSCSSKASLVAALSGVMLYYELATPIEVDIVPAKNMSYLVYDLGTETQLPVNPPLVTPITAPFVGTFEYKSNFKDTVIDLIDKVNNAANPVKGINNTDQTIGKIAVYDSASTVHSSSYSPSNATIVEGATGNNIILPSVEALTTYVNSKLSSALTYKGTITQWSDLPTSGQSTGDMYIAANSFTEGSTTYNAGDFFVWNGTSWDIVTGTTSVVDNNPTITPNGNTYQIGTIDGVALRVTTPNLSTTDPTASGNSLTYIDSISQTNGLISATKKTIYSASTTQSGVVTLSGVEDATNNNNVPTAFDVLENLNNRDVDSGTISNGIATLSKRMIDDDSESQTYGDWINKTFYPTTKFAAIDDFSTAFGTNYPDLNTIEDLSTTGFLKRTGNNTWILTDDTGKMKWLDEVTSTYTYSDASTNSEELGSYIHNYNGITSIQKAVISNNNYGFRINVPILSSSLATVGTVLKGTKSQGVDTLPTWEKLHIEEIDELDNLGATTGYLKRTAQDTWTLDTPVSTTVTTTRNDGTVISAPTRNVGIKVTSDGTTSYHKVPFSAISNDNSTGDYAVTIILNGNFS